MAGCSKLQQHQHARLAAIVFFCSRMMLLLQPHTQELQNQAAGGK
jgi:hypothetical protein